MEYGGVALVAAVIVVLAIVVPARIDKQTALTQSRELDRFSPDLRMLDLNETIPRPENCSQASAEPGTLPAASSPIVMTHGDIRGASHLTKTSEQETSKQAVNPDMSVKQTQSRRQGAASGKTSVVRQISRLKARRAARLSTERAAGQRRMAMSAAAAGLTAVLAVIGTLTALSLAWTAIPALALVALLVVSRTAAVKSERIGAAEIDELSRLRDTLNHGWEVPTESRKPVVEAAQEENAAAEGATSSSQGAANNAVVARSARGTAAVEDTQSTQAHVVSSSAQADQQEDAQISGEQQTDDAVQGDQQRRWTVAHIPAPTYVTGERVAHRIVHTDTDLRGIPRVSARVPARPVSVSVEETAESTEEVAARGVVSFDLEEVLDQRRA